MGKPRVFTDSRLRAEYAKCSDPVELAKRLDTTPQTVYRHLARLGLRAVSTKRTPGFKFTDEEVIEAIKSSSSFTQAALKLGTTPSTVCRYAQRLDIKLDQTKITDEMAIDNFYAYQGEVSLTDMANKLNLSPSTVQSMLIRAANLIWNSEEPPTLPKPWTVLDIKIYHLVSKFGPDIATQPDRLPKAKNLTITAINNYLSRAEEAAIQKARHDVSPVRYSKKVLKKADHQ